MQVDEAGGHEKVETRVLTRNRESNLGTLLSFYKSHVSALGLVSYSWTSVIFVTKVVLVNHLYSQATLSRFVLFFFSTKHTYIHLHTH